MTGEFDPYHRWLGIPAREQPPNHYRLLGLAPFEDDLEVIRDAAERQMAHVRRYALGRHAELSQKILNELGTAKACLTDAARKAAYDRRLREQSPTANEDSAAAKTLPPGTPKAAQRPAVSATASAAVPTAGSAAVPAATQRVPGGQDARAPAAQDARAPVFGAPSRPAASPIQPLAAPKTFVSATPSSVAVAEGARPGGSVSAHDSVSRQTGALHKRLPRIISAGVALLLVMAAASLLMLQFAGSKAPAKPSDAQKPADGKVDADPKHGAIQPPKLAAIQDQTVDQGSLLRLPVIVAQPGSAGHLVYQLAADKPEGVQIDPQSGLLTWTPSARQRPGTYPITVQVSAPELGNVGDQTTFRVHVREVNRPPRLMPFNGMFSAEPDKPLRIHFQATDPDQPRDKLRFSLVAKPEGAQFDAVSGDFAWTPSGAQAGANHRVTVRVNDDGPGALGDEKQFTILVLRPMKPVKIPSPKDAYFRLAFPSGRTLTSEVFKDLERKARADAENGIRLFLKNGLDVAVPDALVYCPDPSQGVSAVINLKAGKLEGPTIAFHETQGPGTRTSSSAAHSPGLPRKPTAPSAQAPRLPDAPPKRYVTFRSEKWDGWLATWNVQGEKHYCCEYSAGKRHGLCCLFKEDRLAMVLECEADAVQTVYLISANAIDKSFDNAEQAEGDSAAGLLLREIDETGSKLKVDGLAFKKAIQQVIDARVAVIRMRNRQETLDRMRQRDEQNRAGQKQRMDNIRKGKL